MATNNEPVMLTPQLTREGLRRLFTLEAPGGLSVAITHVGLTSTAFDATAEMTSLPDEINRWEILDGEEVEGEYPQFNLYLEYPHDGVDLPVRGYGIYLSDGTLLAVYSSDQVESYLSSRFMLDSFIHLMLPGAQSDTLTVINTGIRFNPGIRESIESLTEKSEEAGLRLTALEEEEGENMSSGMASYDIETLRASVVEEPVIFIKGKSGGIFYLSESSKASEDGGMVNGVRSPGTVVKLDSASGDGRYLRDYAGPVYAEWFGAKTGQGFDNAGPFHEFFKFPDRVLTAGDYFTSEFINNGSGKLVGSGTQHTKIFYTGNNVDDDQPLPQGVFFRYSSGAVVRDLRIFGGYSASQDVSDNLVGFSDAGAIGQDGRANRAILNNVRAESFGVNFYFSGSQNTNYSDLFAQYAKHTEFWFNATENCWPHCINSNSSLQIGLSPVEDYKLLRLIGNRNLSFTNGIHERADGAENPYLIDGGDASFYRTEFNGTSGTEDKDGTLWRVVSGGSGHFKNCAWTLTGSHETMVECDESSGATVASPRLSGASGRHRYSLLKGNVRDGSKDCAISLFGSSPLKRFYQSSGGSGSVGSDGQLLINGANGVQGVVMSDQGSNNNFPKLADDGIIAVKVSLFCTELNADQVNVYLPMDTAPWRQWIGNFSAAGHHEFMAVPNVNVGLSHIGLGVTNGDCKIAARGLKLYK